MELALPHVIVRVCSPGSGPAVIAALSVHPVEVSEARGVSEMHRVSSDRPPLLVVLTDPPETRSAVVETWAVFPGVPILIVSDSADSFVPGTAAARGWVDAVPSGQSVQNICWHVLEAISRAARLPEIVERPLGPVSVELDERGVFASEIPANEGLTVAGRRIHRGESILSLLDPLDRNALARILERSGTREAEFCTVRMVGGRGDRHVTSIGVRTAGPGRVTALIHPLILGGPLVGRHVNTRDPITGLLTRWAMSRELEARERDGAAADHATLLILTLGDFSAISSYIGHRQTDVVLERVASALTAIFAHPALNSRLMGDTFLTIVPDAEPDACLARAERAIEAVNGIDVPGFAPGFTIRASIGMANVTGGDHDLALRLAEAAAVEAQAAGGDRTVVAGAAGFTRVQAGELTACMDGGTWEVWLQPVVRSGDGRIEFHETLARFNVGQRRIASRADFFIAGRAEGLLERFDRMMLQRALEILESHPEARLSVNVSYETFVSESFSVGFLERIRELPRACERIILEIAPRCMAAPGRVVGRRLRDLAAAGVAVALDDFGSGVCRLAYLTQLPLAMVKLDALVTGYVDDDPLQREFVRTVVSLCRARGITTVAEYARSPEQLARLVADGVDLFQGELFGMPRPAEDVFAPATPSAAHG